MRKCLKLPQHPTNPKLLAAACGTMGVYISGNNGLWWEANKEGLPAGKSVRKIAIPNWDYNEEGIRHFAGVFGDGLYKSKRIIAGIEDEQPAISGTYVNSVNPNPAVNKAEINWTSSVEGFANISIYDSFGKLVFNANNIQASINNYFAWNCSEVPSGVYFVTIDVNGHTANSKVIVNR